MIFFISIQILIEHSVVNSRYPDKMLRSVASDLGLHCLPMPIKRTLCLYGLWDYTKPVSKKVSFSYMRNQII